jgi:hypothetical protein
MKSLALGFLVSVIFFSLPTFAMGEKVSAQQPSSSETTTANGDSVWVMRPDGSQSCSAKSGESLDDGADELKHANIHVLDSKKNASLKMHSQLCGLPTGTSNAYLISRSDLPRALTLGYQQAK